MTTHGQMQFLRIDMCNTYNCICCSICNPYTLITLFSHTVECIFYMHKCDSFRLTMCKEKIFNHSKIRIFPFFSPYIIHSELYFIDIHHCRYQHTL